MAFRATNTVVAKKLLDGIWRLPWETAMTPDAVYQAWLSLYSWRVFLGKMQSLSELGPLSPGHVHFC